MKKFEVSEFILASAFRYALGRRTYAVQEVVNCLERYWSDLRKHTHEIIQREIREAIANGRAGDDCDVEEWKRLLKK